MLPAFVYHNLLIIYLLITENMFSDFHVQPLRTLHCLFDQSHGTLNLHSHVLRHCCFFTAKHNVLKFSFQIPSHPTLRFVLFYFSGHRTCETLIKCHVVK